MKTFSPRPRDIERRWYVVDADGVVLGRLATHVASILRGKHKPIYAPHADTGDHVIVVNARGIRVTGGKEFEKVYYRHSGYPGGLRRIGYEGLLAERPALAVEKAIGGMLPKNRLGRQMLRKLSVYEGAEHPHQAQKPVALGLGEYPRWEGLPKPPPAPPAEAKPRARKATSGPRARTEVAETKSRPSGSRRSGAGAKAKPAGGARGTAKVATRGTGRKTATKEASAPAARAKTEPTAKESKTEKTESKPKGGAKAAGEGRTRKRAPRRAKKES